MDLKPPPLAPDGPLLSALDALQTLVDTWEAQADRHERRAEDTASDPVNFNRQDAYAYAGRLHARRLRAALARLRDLPLVAASRELDNHHNALTCPYCNPEGLALAPSPAALEAWLDGRAFYEVMQVYRHTPLTPPMDVVEAFVAVKRAILRALSAPHE